MYRLEDDEIGRVERKNGGVAPVHGLPGGVILSLRAPDSAGLRQAMEVRR